MQPVATIDKRIDEIDGLRAVAMSMVVAQHCGLMPFGWTGVWLFFVISGFVITRTLIAERAGTCTPGQRYRSFMARRFFRIVPVYALYLSVACLALYSSGARGGFADVPFLLTFTYNWQMIYGLAPVAERFASFGHLWTLSVEEQFYVFYPLLFLFVPARWFRTVLFALVVAGPVVRLLTSLALQSSGRGTGDVAFGIYASSLCQFDAFVIGAIVATWERELKGMTAFATTVLKAAVAVAAAYAAVMATINAASGARGLDIVRNIYSGIIAGHGREILTYMVVNGVAVAAVIAAVAGHPILAPLRNRALVWVGTVSYGAYLFHALVIWAMYAPIVGSDGGVPRRIFLFLAAWLVTIALASLSFVYFERPIMRRARRRTQQRPARPADASNSVSTGPLPLRSR